MHGPFIPGAEQRPYKRVCFPEPSQDSQLDAEAPTHADGRGPSRLKATGPSSWPVNWWVVINGY